MLLSAQKLIDKILIVGGCIAHGCVAEYVLSGRLSLLDRDAFPNNRSINKGTKVFGSVLNQFGKIPA
jgi:hypothetical protein